MRAYERLEAEWAKFNGLDPAGMVACSSGTAALHLALEAFRLPARSEAIVPDYTMVAVPRAVTLAGMEPVFIDCGPDLLIDHDEFARRRNSGPDVVVAVHTYGRRVHEDLFYHADQYNWLVVEDLAEAHGVRPDQFTAAACWSFYRNKIVAGEEGGAVWFRDPDHAALARQLRTLGFTEAHDYTHVPRGHNYRISDLNAEAVYHPRFSTSIPGYEANVFDRRTLEGLYDVLCPPEWRQPARQAPWVYDFRVRGMPRELQDRMVREIRALGIEARHGFKPMTSLEEYRDGTAEARHPNAYAASREVVYLPLAGVSAAQAEAAFVVARTVGKAANLL